MEDLLNFPSFRDEDAFEAKTLFLSGDQSNNIMPHHTQELRRLFPKAYIKIIDAARHWLHVDNPKQVASHLTEFFTP